MRVIPHLNYFELVADTDIENELMERWSKGIEMRAVSSKIAPYPFGNPTNVLSFTMVEDEKEP